MNELEELYGTDEQLEAECRVLGTILNDPAYLDRWPGQQPLLAFCNSFHAATYYAVLAAWIAGRRLSLAEVWAQVQSHADAEAMGLAQIEDLARDAASPETFDFDNCVMFQRASDRFLLRGLRHTETVH